MRCMAEAGNALRGPISVGSGLARALHEPLVGFSDGNAMNEINHDLAET